MPDYDPQEQRRFAASIVRRLRDAGLEAYWAGGCVRDQLLGRMPKDYDVATAARPDEIRAVFGKRRTLAIGAAFGVITVLGSKRAGQVEVATFRRDLGYSDGRHPDAVDYSTAEEDASRRDFTINGLFFDPVDERVIDFVDGQRDLEARLIRAIGVAEERFREDHLRMLRAVRFAATLGFEIEPRTMEAVRAMADRIDSVSPERIGGEMRRMLTDPKASRAIRLIIDSRLAECVWPELVDEPMSEGGLDLALTALDHHDQPTLALALATVLCPCGNPEQLEAITDRWRLSNKEGDRAAWLVTHRSSLHGAATKRWSAVQRLFVDPGIEELARLLDACVAIGRGHEADSRFVREKLSQPASEINPPSLLTGNDLIGHGVTPGPHFGPILEGVRDAQLDGVIATQEEALALADRLLAEGE